MEHRPFVAGVVHAVPPLRVLQVAVWELVVFIADQLVLDLSRRFLFVLSDAALHLSSYR